MPRAPLSIPFNASATDAVAIAKAREVELPRAFYALPAEKRAQAFTVSRLAGLDQIQAVKDELDKTLASGGTLREFQRWAASSDLGLPRHHLETVYRNAAQTAYNAGHWRRFERDSKARPYLMYDAINDSRTRPAHRALDGVIRPVGDEFWKTHSPQLGYNCRCRLISLSQAEAMARGGVTHSPPAEGRADAGWGHKPTDPFKGLQSAVASRLDKCRVFDPAFASGPIAAPIWCHDGPARDLLLMQQAWTARRGAMPEPRPLNLAPIHFTTAPASFAEFMRALSPDAGASHDVTLPTGDVLHVDADLFKTATGEWKITKRGRDQWLRYLAALLLAPQEVWALPLAMSTELYVLGRFMRGRQRLDALAVFRRRGDSGRWEGKTAYVADSDVYLDEKRQSLLSHGASTRFIQV